MGLKCASPLLDNLDYQSGFRRDLSPWYSNNSFIMSLTFAFPKRIPTSPIGSLVDVEFFSTMCCAGMKAYVPRVHKAT